MAAMGSGPVRDGCTATKYRNTHTAICHPAGLCDTLPCSDTNVVAVA